MRLKWTIIIFILIIAVMVIVLEDAEQIKVYDLTISESLLEVNFEIRRQEAYNGQGDFAIEEDYTKQGVVDLFYNAGTNKKIKMVISKGRKQYVYDIENDPLFVYFPLQLGSGDYTIEIFEQVKGEKFKKVYKQEFEVNLKDDRLVYLNTIQLVDWQMNNEAVMLAEDLIIEEKIKRFEAGGTSYTGQELPKLRDLDKINVIYRYVVENIRYDFSKLETLEPEYIPDIEDVFDEKEGICYDYSAILASMLRRLNIPTKLIKGYTNKTDVFHAWNEVYVEDENRWIIIDTTYDAYMFERVKPYEMEKDQKDYTPTQEF